MKLSQRAGITILGLSICCAIWGLYPEIDQELAKTVSFLAFVLGGFTLLLSDE